MYRTYHEIIARDIHHKSGSIFFSENKNIRCFIILPSWLVTKKYFEIFQPS